MMTMTAGPFFGHRLVWPRALLPCLAGARLSCFVGLPMSNAVFVAGGGVAIVALPQVALGFELGGLWGRREKRSVGGPPLGRSWSSLSRFLGRRESDDHPRVQTGLRGLWARVGVGPPGRARAIRAR